MQREIWLGFDPSGGPNASPSNFDFNFIIRHTPTIGKNVLTTLQALVRADKIFNTEAKLNLKLNLLAVSAATDRVKLCWRAERERTSLRSRPSNYREDNEHVRGCLSESRQGSDLVWARGSFLTAFVGVLLDWFVEGWLTCGCDCFDVVELRESTC